MATSASSSERAAAPPFFVATPAQERFFTDLLSGRYRIMALGGAIRGTKTYAALGALLLLARMFPRSRWAVVRRDLPTLRRTVVPSFEKLRPHSFVGPLLQSTWTYTCANGSEILLFPESAPGDPERNRWRGLEVNGLVLEEANELEEDSYQKALERAGTWIIPPDPSGARHTEQPPPFIFLTFNPDDGYVRREFYEPYKAGTLAAPKYFLPLTPKDNPYVTDEQWAIWSRLPAPLYARFIQGDWGIITQPNQLIPFSSIQTALDAVHRPGQTREGLDVARFGDDATVFARMEGNALVELSPRHGQSIAETATMAQHRLVASGVAADAYVVDSVGLGAGVVDNMHANGFTVREFVAGARPVVRQLPDGRPALPWTGGPLVAGDASAFRFYDLRTQAWFELADKLRNGDIRIAVTDRAALDALIQDLTAVRYEFVKDRTVKVESKDQVKRRIGRSTDYGDAFVMAAFDFPERAATRARYPASHSFVTR